jgi:GNAT superfamily N-acetyltransferase
VKYAPPRFFPQVARMPVPPDEDSVLIACLHVEAGLREAGLGKVLMQAALRDLVSRGERTVEAYAAAGPADRGEDVPLMTVEFLLRQGFIVSRPHPRYPLMRLELRTLAAWTESLESVLESLQLPLSVRERVPSSLARP